MSDTIGPDGLTDEERGLRDYYREAGSRAASTAHGALATLAVERLAHAETRAERDRLRVVLWEIIPIAFPSTGGADGCGTVGGYKADVLTRARALLGEAKARVKANDFENEDPMTTPTIPVTPATDEEVEAVRDGEKWPDLTVVDALIARIDALKAEVDAALISSGDTILKAAQEASAWRARVSELEVECDELKLKCNNLQKDLDTAHSVIRELIYGLS